LRDPVQPPRDDVPDLAECLRRGLNPNDPGVPTYGDRRKKKPETEEERTAMSTKKKSKTSSSKDGNKVRQRIERATYTKELPIPASRKEIEGAASAMAIEIRKREQLLEQRRESMAGFKSKLTGVDEKLLDLCATVEKGTKKGSVKCKEYLIVETNEIQVVRTDTGEVVETRTASAEDRQDNLFPKLTSGDNPEGTAEGEADQGRELDA